MDKTFEDRLFDAVVAKFFEPEQISTTSYNQQTGQMEPILALMPSPAARVAADIFTAKHNTFVEAVMERLDIDAVVERLWEKVLERLTTELLKKPDYYSTYDPFKTQREAMQKQVRELVAQELARRALAKMDEEQQRDAAGS